MGCGLSRPPVQVSTFQGVRVVHINGYVEDYPGPITVGQITGKPPKMVCFSRPQLISLAPRPLPLDDTLQPGRLYFLLPPSILRSETSPADLATLATRLTALARNGPAPPPEMPELPEPAAVGVMASSLGRDHAALPGRPEPEVGSNFARRMPSRARSWRPKLDPIEERSLGRSMRSLSSRSGSSHRRGAGD